MKSEDGIVVTNDFIAVIDGSTSKSQYRHSLFRSNGRYAMQLVGRYIRRMPKNTTCEAFLRGVTAYIRKHYKKTMLSRMAEHPEDRLTCSVVVFSRLCREIWMIGDCQCLVDNQYYDNPKPAEAVLAAQRAVEMKRLLEQGLSQDELLRNDTARPLITLVSPYQHPFPSPPYSLSPPSPPPPTNTKKHQHPKLSSTQTPSPSK